MAVRTVARLAGALLLTAGSLAVAQAGGAVSLRAKDLPRRAAAPIATTCDAYGSGFVKVDGTDTCIHVSGSVRLETGVTVGGGGTGPAPQH